MESSISFVVHDSIVLDVKETDVKHMTKIANMFETTRYGNFNASMKIGKNYG